MQIHQQDFVSINALSEQIDLLTIYLDLVLLDVLTILTLLQISLLSHTLIIVRKHAFINAHSFLHFMDIMTQINAYRIVQPQLLVIMIQDYA